MCAPIILPDAAMGLVAAHILGVVLISGIMVFNSNVVRKGMGSLLGFGEGIDSPINRVISMMSR
jgi:hypothetical protein